MTDIDQAAILIHRWQAFYTGFKLGVEGTIGDERQALMKPKVAAGYRAGREAVTETAKEWQQRLGGYKRLQAIELEIGTRYHSINELREARLIQDSPDLGFAQVIEKVAVIVGDQYRVFHVELVMATTGCVARALVGKSEHDQHDLTGIGDSLDAAIAVLYDRAYRWMSQSQFDTRTYQSKQDGTFTFGDGSTQRQSFVMWSDGSWHGDTNLWNQARSVVLDDGTVLKSTTHPESIRSDVSNMVLPLARHRERGIGTTFDLSCPNRPLTENEEAAAAVLRSELKMDSGAWRAMNVLLDAITRSGGVDG